MLFYFCAPGDLEPLLARAPRSLQTQGHNRAPTCTGAIRPIALPEPRSTGLPAPDRSSPPAGGPPLPATAPPPRSPRAPARSPRAPHARPERLTLAPSASPTLCSSQAGVIPHQPAPPLRSLLAGPILSWTGPGQPACGRCSYPRDATRPTRPTAQKTRPRAINRGAVQLIPGSSTESSGLRG
jgi:hypothetical protein